jgi:hypothetical protein
MKTRNLLYNYFLIKWSTAEKTMHLLHANYRYCTIIIIDRKKKEEISLFNGLLMSCYRNPLTDS